MLTGPDALCTGGFTLLGAAWMTDKQTYYWALIDRSTARPAHSKDSTSYFMALLISHNSLYIISPLTFVSLLSLLISCGTMQKGQGFASVSEDHFLWGQFDVDPCKIRQICRQIWTWTRIISPYPNHYLFVSIVFVRSDTAEIIL